MIDRAWLVLRALALVLVLQSVGGALFCEVFRSALAGAAPVARRTAWQVSAIALAVLVAQALCEPMHLAGDVSGLTDPSMLRLFIGSGATASLALRIAGVACASNALRPRATASNPAALAAVLLTAGSFVLTGHTVIAAHRWLLALLLSVHVAVVTFWFGALWPLRQVLALEPPLAAARTVEAFSSLAVWLVPLLALAGVAMAALLLPNAAALGRPWGLLLCAKALLFTALMALASLNRLRLTPALGRGEAHGAARLSGTIALEYLLICVTLAVTAVMTGSFSPAEP